MKSSQADTEAAAATRQSADRRQRIVRGAATVAALVAIASELLRMAPVVWMMATTSLWLDEFIGILNFTAQGPLHVATCYPFPNHILYTLVNSLTPGAASVLPWRARLWSFIAVGALVGVILAFFTRRRRGFEAVLFLQIVAANAVALNLYLQARGYGFTALAALVSSMACVRYFERRDRVSILAVSTCCILGTYAVTSYLFFAAPFLVVLWIVSRDRRWLRAGVFCAAAICLLHLPVVFELWQVMRDYAANYGKAYTGLASVAATLSNYGLDLPAWALTALLGGVAIDHWLANSNAPDCRAGRVLLISATAFFIACLMIETPVIRATSFIVFPLLMAGFLSLSRSIPGLARPWLTVAGQPIPAGLDRDAATQWTGPVQSALRSPLTVRIVPDEKRAFSALTLVTAPGELPLEFVVAVGTPEGERLVPRKRITMENDWLEVAFDGASVEWVEIRVRPSVYPKPFSIREAWLAP